MSHDNERTSPRIAALAAKAMRDPSSLTPEEVRALAASALTQAPDKPEEPGPEEPGPPGSGPAASAG